jgi:hypothetical protein
MPLRTTKRPLNIRSGGPTRGRRATVCASDVWFNHRRWLEPIGYIQPAEYEARYY